MVKLFFGGKVVVVVVVVCCISHVWEKFILASQLITADVLSPQIAPAFWSHLHSKLVKPTVFKKKKSHTRCFSQAYLARAVLGSGVCQGNYAAKSHGSWAGSGATNWLDSSLGDDIHVPQSPQKAECYIDTGTQYLKPLWSCCFLLSLGWSTGIGRSDLKHYVWDQKEDKQDRENNH